MALDCAHREANEQQTEPLDEACHIDDLPVTPFSVHGPVKASGHGLQRREIKPCVGAESVEEHRWFGDLHIFGLRHARDERPLASCGRLAFAKCVPSRKII